MPVTHIILGIATMLVVLATLAATEITSPVDSDILSGMAVLDVLADNRWAGPRQ